VLVRTNVPDRATFHPAVVLDDVTAPMAIAQEEVFGPVVALLEAADLDEALRIHNDVAYGLSGSIFTRDLATAEAFIATARVGLVTSTARPRVPSHTSRSAMRALLVSRSWQTRRFFTRPHGLCRGLPTLGPFDR